MDPASHPGCRVPAPIAARHRAVTSPHHNPLLLQGPNSCSSCYPPSTGHPKTPLGRPSATAAWCRAMGGIKMLPMGPLHPASPPQFGCRPGPAQSPPSPSHSHGARAKLGSRGGWKLCAAAPRGRQASREPPEPGQQPPPSQGCTPGVQVGDQPSLRSPNAPACPASPPQARCHLPSCSAAIFS